MSLPYLERKTEHYPFRDVKNRKFGNFVPGAGFTRERVLRADHETMVLIRACAHGEMGSSG